MLLASTLLGNNFLKNLPSTITIIFVLFWAVYCRKFYGNTLTKKELLNAIWILAFVQSFFAILQQLTGSSIGNFQNYFGSEVESGGDVLQVIVSRVRGTLGHPNLVANWLVVSLPFMLTYKATNDKPVYQLLRSSIIIMSLVALVFTFSRGSIGIFLLLLLSIYALYRLIRVSPRISLKLNIISFVIFTAIIIVISIFSYQKRELIENVVDMGYDRINETFEGGTNSRTSGDFRMMMNVDGLRYMAKTPIIGIGYDNSKFIWDELNTPIPWWWRHRPHNIFIIFGIEAGLLGLLFYIYMVLTPLKKLFFTNWLKDSFSFSLMFALLACLGFSQIYVTPISGEFAPLFFGFLGLAMGHTDQLRRESQNNPPFKKM